MADLEQLQQENQRLQLAVKELSVLNEIATAITSTQPLEEIIDQIVFKCIKHLSVEEGTISLLEREEDEEEFQTMIRKQDISKIRVPIKLDSHVTGWMIKNKKPLLSNDIKEDDRFRMISKELEHLRSILSVPLMVKGELIGYLAVFNKKGDQDFTEEDQRLLSIIASQSAQVIENARLYEEEKALIGLQEEMRLAKEIQLKLLPETNPDFEDYQVSAINLPAKDVSGDYFDFIQLDDQRLGFCVGDITGKGIPAALLMANLQASLRSQTIMFTECCDCLRGTNRLLYKNTEVTKFATLIYGILDIQNHTVRYSNGGHNHPILLRQGDGITELETTGMLLGVMEDATYDESELSLESGDILVLYSDGITEAMNNEDDEFGLDRLSEIVQDYSGESADILQQQILASVREHTGDVPQSDDITLMIIKRV